MGVIGINRRNAEFVLPNNSRRLYSLVDNKLETKRLAEQRELAVPQTYGVIHSPHGLRRLAGMLENLEGGFVIKPTYGSGGKGVLVISGRDENRFVKMSGVLVSLDEVKDHVTNILAGLYSLGGRRDVALIEYRVMGSRVLNDISFQGAPDIRVVMFHGYPVMAMLRSATRESDGRANLHQGALGVGIDIASGRTVKAVHYGKPVTMHPDLKVPVLGIYLPDWEHILDIAVTCYEMTKMGYLGVDVMIDEEKGPMMIEVNARPGLAIQMANGEGLLGRLQAAEAQAKRFPYQDRREKVEFSRKNFAVADLGA